MSRRAAFVLTMALLYCGAGFVRADMAMAQAPATGTVIITLGTRGGPFPTKDRTQSSNLLVVNGTPILSTPAMA
jgi:hypothetical protein